MLLPVNVYKLLPFDVMSEIIDAKCVKLPDKFDGTAAKWRHFNIRLLAYVGGVSVQMKNLMKVAAELEKPIDRTGLGFSEAVINIDEKLFTILSSVL